MRRNPQVNPVTLSIIFNTISMHTQKQYENDKYYHYSHLCPMYGCSDGFGSHSLTMSTTHSGIKSLL